MARRKARYTIPIKLWVDPPLYAVLKQLADAEDREVPDIIRRLLRAQLGLAPP